jgi:hypothetical protein
MRTSTTTTVPSTTTPYKYPYTLSFEKHWFIPDAAYEYLYYAVQPNTITKTIPDLVNILHAFWRIQRIEKFNKLVFPNGWNSKVKDNLSMLSFEKSHTSNVFKGISSQLSQQFRRKLSMEISMILISLMNSTTSTSSLKNISKPMMTSKMNFLMTNFLLKAFDPKFPISLQLTMTSTRDHQLQSSQLLQQQPTFRSIAGAGIATLANTGSYLYNARSNSPDVATLKNFRQHAKQFTNIQINQNQITNAINDVNKKLTYFESQIVGKFEGTAILILEEDLRSFIIQLQSVIQITLLKYNAAMSAAADLRTSPYVLPQSDLDNIANVMIKTKNFRISGDLSTVKTYTHIENQQITFIFDIPIIDNKKEFLLYTIAFLPSFKASVTLIPQLDSNHIAINSQGDKYTVLNEL